MKRLLVLLLCGGLLAACADDAADKPRVDNASETVRLADTTIEYFSEGQGDVVVLLPGGGLNVSYMEGLAQSLSKAGYRVVRINPQGAGTSKSAVDAVTLRDLAGDVAGVIEALDVGPVHVTGHAFGNRVARMLAADHPELVRSVILLAAGGKVAATPEADAALEVVFSPTATDEEYLASMKYMVGDPKDAKILKPVPFSSGPRPPPTWMTGGHLPERSDISLCRDPTIKQRRQKTGSCSERIWETGLPWCH